MKRLTDESGTEAQIEKNRAATKTAAPIDLRTYIAAGLTVVLWASAFPGIRAAMHSYTPEYVALIRYGTASIALAIYALFVRIRLPRLRDLPFFALLGLVGIAYYNVALNAGEVHVVSAEASFIVASAPIFIAIEAIIILRERLRLWGWLGIVICFAGIGIITLNRNTGLHLDGWSLLVLSAAIAQSLYSVGQKSLLRRYTAFECTAYAIWLGTIFLLIFTPGLFSAMRTAPMDTTLAAVYLGVFPGALAYVTWAYALSRLPASTAASFLYLVPIVASGIAWLWLGEVPTVFALFGGLFVLGGVILVNTRGKVRKSLSA